MKINRGFIFGLAAGWMTGCAVALAGFAALRHLWPAYAAVEAQHAYTLPMSLSRLTLGVVGAASAGAVATLIARDTGRAAWWLGGQFLALSLAIHIREWALYPVWYHLVYLTYLAPVTGLGGALAARVRRGGSEWIEIRHIQPVAVVIDAMLLSHSETSEAQSSNVRF